MSSPFKLIAVLVAAGFCVPAAFAADAVTSASVVPAAQKTQDGAVLEGTKTLAAKGGDRLPDNVDAVTSASVVPVQYRQTDWKPSGFTDAKDKKRALFILDDPRHESVTYDLCVTAMKFFEEKGFEVELRDLIANKFNPLITTREEFYHAKDGFGKTPADVLTEQAFVKKADHIIFVQPNWQDTDPMFTKGYKLRVFSKGFSYDDGPKGRVGLLPGKTFYTIKDMKREQNVYALDDMKAELDALTATSTPHLHRTSLRYLFVDEFQDTDNSQIGSLAWLAHTMGAHLFVVGDVKQSIYRFRGAEESAFEVLQNTLATRGLRGALEFTLKKNYRTAPAIIRDLNSIFSYWATSTEKLLLWDADAVAQTSLGGRFQTVSVKPFPWSPAFSS